MTREKFFKACTSQTWYWVKKHIKSSIIMLKNVYTGWHSCCSCLDDTADIARILNTAAAAPVAVWSFFCLFFVVKACLNRARQPPRTRPLRFPTPGFPLESSHEPRFIQNALIRAVTVGNVCCRAPSHENGNNFPSIFLFLCLFKITTAFIV